MLAAATITRHDCQWLLLPHFVTPEPTRGEADSGDPDRDPIINTVINADIAADALSFQDHCPRELSLDFL